MGLSGWEYLGYVCDSEWILKVVNLKVLGWGFWADIRGDFYWLGGDNQGELSLLPRQCRVQHQAGKVFCGRRLPGARLLVRTPATAGVSVICCWPFYPSPINQSQVQPNF